jgi:hypothetical protein
VKPTVQTKQQGILAYRYFQDIVEAEIERAKSNGTYTKGVQFISEGTTLAKQQTIWRHPQGEHKGVVRAPHCLRLRVQLATSICCKSAGAHVCVCVCLCTLC